MASFRRDTVRVYGNRYGLVLLASGRPVEPDAYELYLRGREARFTSESEDDLERAERYYRLAIERQPEFSQAWAGLGELDVHASTIPKPINLSSTGL